MYAVGYSDTKAFRTLFKQITGVLPGAYRDKSRWPAPAVPAA